MIRILKLASLSMLVAACGGKDQPQPSSPAMGEAQPCEAHPCGPQPCQPCGEAAQGAEPAQIEVADWQNWEKVSKERSFSKSHGESWVDIYVPAESANAYVGGEAPPEGMKIVKAQYPSEDAEEPEALTVMARQEGETPSGWFWGVYTPDGRQAMQQGELSNCVNCHETADEHLLFRELE